MNYDCRYNVVSRQHADCMTWGKRIALHSSLPQGNVNSRDSSNCFSATESGEQDTSWGDVTHSFMGEAAVIRYGLSPLSDTDHTCSERPALAWDKKKSAINDCWILVDYYSENWVNIKMVLMWTQRDLVKSVDEIFKKWLVLWAAWYNFREQF